MHNLPFLLHQLHYLSLFPFLIKSFLKAQQLFPKPFIFLVFLAHTNIALNFLSVSLFRLLNRSEKISIHYIPLQFTMVISNCSIL